MVYLVWFVHLESARSLANEDEFLKRMAKVLALLSISLKSFIIIGRIQAHSPSSARANYCKFIFSISLRRIIKLFVFRSHYNHSYHSYHRLWPPPFNRPVRSFHLAFESMMKGLGGGARKRQSKMQSVMNHRRENHKTILTTQHFWVVRWGQSICDKFMFSTRNFLR